MTIRLLFGMSLLALSACTSAPDIRYFTLSAQAPSIGGAARIDHPQYAIDSVRVPDALDRPQIVIDAGPNSGRAGL
jgi:uncharacterized lipoprotein YmbA